MKEVMDKASPEMEETLDEILGMMRAQWRQIMGERVTKWASQIR
jgi:hypothetical protein